MKPETSLLLGSIAVASLLLSGTAPGQSGTIANWKEFNAGSINSGMDTDSPAIGDGSAGDADNAWVAGRFGTVASPVSITLAVGETLTVSGRVVLTGGAGNNDQFRFGVYDDGGQFALDGTTWSSGGWIYEPQDGIYQARTNGVFVSTNSNATLIGPDSSTGQEGWSADSTTAYDWSFSVTRDSATTVDLVATLTGGDNGVSRTSTVNNQATSLFTYTAIGVLFGGGMDLDQGALSKVQYAVSPAGGGNAAPVFTSDPVAGNTARVNVSYSGTLAGAATDSDGDPLTYAKVGGPAWLGVAGDGTLSGTPGNGDLGGNSFTISVTDNIAPAVNATLHITVNSAPVVTGLTYVDAVEGPGGNTYATGGFLSDTSWLNPGTDSGAVNGQWKKRAFSNGGTIFQSNLSSAGSQTELKTEIAGLADGAYDVWVFFWDAAGSNQWNISAGLGPGSLDTYSFDGLGDTGTPVAASTLTYSSTPLFAEADRIMYAVKLGQVGVSGGSAIEVFVNGLYAGSSDRTWYDGVGYEQLQDTDGDGLSDAYENAIIDADPADGVTGFADVMGTGAAPAVTDFDNDGSNDANEFANRTDPVDPDSDNDTLPDGVETNTGAYVSAADTGTDPLNPDSDGDGLLDGVERNTGQFVSASDPGTSPFDPDSDDDGLSDGVEVSGGTNPNDATDPNPFALGTPIQLAPDGVWTWFNDERSIWHLGKLYTGYVMRNGKVGISRFDPATMQTTHTSLSGFTQVDDHNNPSITILPDNRLMVVYSQHNGSAFRRISNVTEPASISDWGGELSTNGTSYANAYRLSGESDRIYLFNRSINWDPTMHISDDDGAGFGPQTHFIRTASSSTRPYPKYFSNGVDRIDLIYTDGHPRNENNSIYHLYYEGDNFRETDGTLVEAVADLPIEHDQGKTGTEVYTYSSSAWGPDDGPDDWIPSGRGWTWDICYGSDGNPVCVFQVQVNNVAGGNWSDDRIYYYYARWTGTEWQRRFIAHGGRGLYSSERDYGGGMAIDPDSPNVVYISTNAANPFERTDIDNVPLAANERYEIWRGTTADGGLTFSWQPVTQGSTSNNLRPIVPADHGYDQSVVWFRGSYNSYTNYDTEVVGVFRNRLEMLEAQWQSESGTFTWASSPGKAYRITASEDLQSFPHEASANIPSEGAVTSHQFTFPAAVSGAPAAFFRVEEQ